MCHVCAVNPDRHCGNGPNAEATLGWWKGASTTPKVPTVFACTSQPGWPGQPNRCQPRESISTCACASDTCAASAKMCSSKCFFTHRSFQVCRDFHPLLIFDKVSIAFVKQYSRSHNASRRYPCGARLRMPRACIRNLARDSLWVIIKTCLLFASSSKTCVAFTAHSTSES